MTKSWGPPTWILFHTLADKIKENHFPLLKNDLINLIKNITSNLPCPDCADHAKQIMNGLKNDSIKSKNDFKEMLFYFHNHVNEKLSKDEFQIDELKIYENYILLNVIQQFFYAWNKLPKNMNLINESFRRKVVLRNLNIWFKKNLKYFDI